MKGVIFMKIEDVLEKKIFTILHFVKMIHVKDEKKREISLQEAFSMKNLWHAKMEANNGKLLHIYSFVPKNHKRGIIFYLFAKRHKLISSFMILINSEGIYVSDDIEIEKYTKVSFSETEQKIDDILFYLK